MKKFFPNTIFARLFALVLAALVVSNIVNTMLFISLGHGEPIPPDIFVISSKPAPPPDGKYFDPSHRPPPEHASEHPPEQSFGPGIGFWLAQTVQFLALATAAWFGAQTVARPIQHLAKAAAQLGDNINSPPLREFGPDETRAAARVLNDMQQCIRQQLEERSRFLAAVSHDLRTPLTRMRLRLTQLGENFLTKKFTDDINEMAAMLDATLQFLRGEAQTEQWQMLDVQALVESLAADALESGFTVPVSGSVKPALLQPISIRRCLSNLIANALQYGGNAQIAVSESSTQIVLEVIDHGPGIPENKMAAVFEPFVRLDESRNKSTGGVGLGLAIARDTAHRNGGELTLHNVASGGLVARITLPRRTQ